MKCAVFLLTLQKQTLRHRIIGFLLLCFLAGCATPTIISIDPPNGSEGMLANIQGTDQLGASIEWDGSQVPGPWYGGVFFTVPYGSATGNHDVTLSNGIGTSSVEVFSVSSPVAIPAPEIKAVQLGGINITGGAFDSGGLMVIGSNIDAGATININGSAVLTYTHQALVNDFAGGVDPQTLGIPAYHYMSLITSVEGLTPGAAIAITVTDLNGVVSAVYHYTLPGSMSALDSDGDGLLDEWEENGYDANGDGVIDVDLPAMGCNKDHMDLLVEVDVMNGLSYTPTPAMWSLVEAAFENAPVLNYDGIPGIAIHIDRGQGGAFTAGGTTVPFYDDVDFTQATTATNLNFYDGKSTYFNSDRLNIFRYALWGYSRYSSTSSGRAEGTPSNDFLVGMDWFGVNYNTDLAQAETFVHELGHTLGFGHGGPPTDGRVDEPNHLSVMSYCWQFLSVQADCTTCTSYYANTSPDYSEGMAAQLNELVLNENDGVCDNIAVDWDGDGTIEPAVQFNINPDDGALSTETLDDYDEWHHITFDFTTAGSGWNSN